MQIFLPEILEYGDKLYPNELPNEVLYEETRNLLAFLIKVANRKLGEEIELGHVTTIFNFRIMIIGIRKKIELGGIEPYVIAAKRIIDDGYKKLYVLTEDTKHADAQKIIDEIKNLPQVTFLQKRNKDICPPKTGIDISPCLL